MPGLLADVHAVAHLTNLVRVCRGPAWREIWDAVRTDTFVLADFGLPDDTADADLWHFCQQRELLLVTGNRNEQGPNSLEATIRQFNTPQSLPVLTLANMRWLRYDRQYLDQASERLLEILLDLDRYRGTGRLYLPPNTVRP
jgi:hypothetical protein